MEVSSKAVFKNIGANFFQFGVKLLIGIFFIKLLIQLLGAELYGIVALSTSITTYYGLITTALNIPAIRYLVVANSNRNANESNSYFNSALCGACLIALMVIIATICVSLILPHVLNIPAVHKTDAIILFLFTGVAFAVVTISNPFGLSTYITNKLYLDSFKEVARDIGRITVAIGAITLLGWKISAVYAGVMCSVFIAVCFNYNYWRILTPELTLSYKLISLAKIKKMISFGGWVFVNQIGALLFLNTELFVVNLLFGAKTTGMYAPLLLFSSTIRTLSIMLNNTLAPIIFNKYASGDKKAQFQFGCRAVRFLGLFVALPVGFISGNAGTLINVWLGENFLGLETVLLVLIIHLSFNLSITPLFHLQVAFKKVKWPAIVTLTMGAGNITLAFILGSPSFGFGLLGVPLAGAIMLTLKNIFFTPIYVGTFIGQHYSMIFKSIGHVLIGFLFVLLLSAGINRYFSVDSILGLAMALITVTISYVAVLMGGLMNKADKDFLLKALLNLR